MPDWFVTSSEYAAIGGLVLMFGAILHIANRIARLKEAGRTQAAWSTIALGHAAGIAASLAFGIMVMLTHPPHSGGLLGLAWALAIGGTGLVLSVPIALLFWLAALGAATKSSSAKIDP